MGRKLAVVKQRYPQPLNEEGQTTKVIRLKNIPSPKNISQEFYLDSLRNSILTLGAGPAGVGKSFLAMAIAVEKLLNNEVSRVVITRPVCEAGENLGFLPGTLEEKISPYLLPLLDALNDLVGPTMAKKLLDDKRIEFAPLAYMRGRTFNNCLPAGHTVRLADGSDIRMDDLLAKVETGESIQVLSFNIETSKVEPKQVQAAFKQPNQHKQLVRVTLENGTVIEATPDHKLYTKNRGYVPVNQLDNSDELLMISDL